MSNRPHSRQVKAELFLKCGKVDMYNMERYVKEKLVLHHDPPFRLTHHTIYEECYILSEETVELITMMIDEVVKNENPVDAKEVEF